VGSNAGILQHADAPYLSTTEHGCAADTWQG